MKYCLFIFVFAYNHTIRWPWIVYEQFIMCTIFHAFFTPFLITFLAQLSQFVAMRSY